MIRTLTVDLNAEQVARLEAEAERRGVSVSHLAGELLSDRLPVHGNSHADALDRRAWSGLSAPSFARDWESDEDQVYDRLS